MRKPMLRFGARLRADEIGAAAVEFAVVLPVFLVILLGVLVYGIYFGVAHGVQQLAAEAARASVAGVNDAERTAIARRTVTETIANYPLLKLENVAFDGRTDNADPTRFIVTLRYDASRLGLSAFRNFLPTPPQAIERIAVVRRGGY